MKNASLILVCTAFMLSLAACGSRKVNIEKAELNNNDVVSMDISYVKDKGKKYDIEMAVTNVSKKDIIFMLQDMQCFRGNSQGVLKHTFFNTGERTIDFRKGQMKKFKMVCDIGAKATGDYKIVIGRVYDNPNADGATKGAVLANNLELKIVGDK